ncbi:hypothetical protein H2248_003837 [Termitomyces sp. 'cryptogamus']|nr:hypothetical protein H2248_003837 [Termitomyces sp. 'cryptogamus']
MTDRVFVESSVVVVVDFPGVPKRTKFCPALPKEGSMGRSAGKAGFLRGGQGKGASSAVICGKRRASPPSGVGPSRRPCIPLEWLSSPPVPIPLITEVFLRKQVEALMTLLAAWEGELQRAREDRDVVQAEKEVMEWERNTSVCMATEQALEVWGLRERLTQMEGQPVGEVEGQGQVPGGDALWAELEAARQREDWLANEAASGHTGVLRWVREHWVLLDSASAAFTLIQDGLMQGSTVQPLELQQGMAQLERLLAGHRRCNAVAPGSMLPWGLSLVPQGFGAESEGPLHHFLGSGVDLCQLWLGPLQGCVKLLGGITWRIPEFCFVFSLGAICVGQGEWDGGGLGLQGWGRGM